MTTSPTADQLPPPGPSNIIIREPIMLPVKCPRCGKTYTRAAAGSVVEVACRGCKEVTIVALVAA